LIQGGQNSVQQLGNPFQQPVQPNSHVNLIQGGQNSVQQLGNPFQQFFNSNQQMQNPTPHNAFQNQLATSNMFQATSNNIVSAPTHNILHQKSLITTSIMSSIVQRDPSNISSHGTMQPHLKQSDQLPLKNLRNYQDPKYINTSVQDSHNMAQNILGTSNMLQSSSNNIVSAPIQSMLQQKMTTSTMSSKVQIKSELSNKTSYGTMHPHLKQYDQVHHQNLGSYQEPNNIQAGLHYSTTQHSNLLIVPCTSYASLSQQISITQPKDQLTKAGQIPCSEQTQTSIMDESGSVSQVPIDLTKVSLLLKDYNKEYREKILELQKYVEPLKKRLENKDSAKYAKLNNLLKLITNKNKTGDLKLLLNCEKVLKNSISHFEPKFF